PRSVWRVFQHQTSTALAPVTYTGSPPRQIGVLVRKSQAASRKRGSRAPSLPWISGRLISGNSAIRPAHHLCDQIVDLPVPVRDQQHDVVLLQPELRRLVLGLLVLDLAALDVVHREIVVAAVGAGG